MKIFNSMKLGFMRSVRASKGILIVWFMFFIMVLVVIYPVRKTLGAAFGSSMITERLSNGLDIEVFADLGPVLDSLMSFLSSGFMFLFFIGFLLNSFLTAGLFGSIRKESGRFSAGEFFRNAAHNFWPFLIITVIINLLLNLVILLIFGIPFIAATASESISESSATGIIGVSGIITLLFVPVFLLIADYARAYKSANEKESCFRALGFGFNKTFSKFRSSYLMMLILAFVQILFGIIVLMILPGWKPVTAGGVLILLIISQLMLYSRIMLKTWRYASVTALMEQTTETVVVNN